MIRSLTDMFGTFAFDRLFTLICRGQSIVWQGHSLHIIARTDCAGFGL